MTHVVATNELLELSVLYCQMEQFYAFQMQVLDDGDASGWAATFTEAGVFTSNGMSEQVMGRARLEDAASDTIARLTGERVTRRHIVSNIRVEQLSDDALRVSSYVPVIDTSDGVARLRTSTVMHDEMVRSGAGWLVRHRTVTRDDIQSP